MRFLKKVNKKGFSLIELLSIIVIVALIFSSCFYYFNNTIEKSKNASNKITYNNIKLSARNYVKEFKKDIVWGDNKVCVSPQTLVAKGFLDKEILDSNNEVKSIIVKKDDNGQILSEQIDTEDDCETYKKTIKIPKISEVCYNFEYKNNHTDEEINNGYSMDMNDSLINSNLKFKDGFTFNYKDSTYNYPNDSDVSVRHPINAGKYKVLLSLNSGNQWEDDTTSPKEFTCTIKKKDIKLKLDQTGINAGEIFDKTEVKLLSEVKGNALEIKTSNKKHVIGKVNSEVVNQNPEYNSSDPESYQYYGIVDILKLSNRDTTTYVTLTLTPESSNYNKTSVVYTVGNIKESVKISKPTNSICSKNNKYTGNDIVLIENKENDPFLVSDGNIQSKIGSYPIKLSLKYGYVWSDGSSDDIIINCDIVAPTLNVRYENAICNPQNIMVTYGKIYGENQKLCIPNETGKTFDGWYTSNNYNEKIDDNTEVEFTTNHTLYAKMIKNKYVINYDCNSGIGNMVSVLYEYDEEKSLTSNSCSKEGYKFKGWNTEADGSGKSYSDKEKVSKLTSINNGTITLYAMWYSDNIKEFEHGVYLCTEMITYSAGSLFMDEKKDLAGIFGSLGNSNMLSSNTPFCYNENEVIDLVKSDCSSFLSDWPFASVYVHKNYVDMSKVKSENIEGDYVFGYIPLQNMGTCMTTLPCPGSEQFKKKWCK